MTTEQVFNGGLVVILEGIKGSGKSTIGKRLAHDLSSHCAVDYVDTTDIYKRLKSLRPTSRGTLLDMIQEAYFFQYMNWLRFQNKERSDVVIVDRFLLSNLVYTLQAMEHLGVEYNHEQVKVNILNPFGLNILDQTVTLYFDCPVEIAQSRVLKRSRNSFNLVQEGRARELYVDELRRYDHPFKLIDNSGDLEIAYSEARSLLESRINL